jgi:exopolyphosphatase/guanosine-5'-triphosphate,3'-diphosphate pyrophosphatase
VAAARDPIVAGEGSGAAAAVDIGSNSIRLLVLAADGRRVTRRIVTTKLAQGVDASGRLHDAAIARTVEALLDLRTVWEQAGVVTGASAVRIAATSAVRDATDRERFLAEVRRLVGVDVEVLTGEQEAALAFGGATRAVEVLAPTVVIDVGGGSTELVVGTSDGEIAGSVSLQLGCVRLTERDLASDPPAGSELAAAERTIAGIVDAGLADLVRQGVDLSGIRSAVAVAGTATTLAALHLGLPEYLEEAIHGAVVPLGAVEALAGRLLAMTVRARADLGPVQPGRAEVLHGGALVLARCLARLGRTEMHVSEADSLDALAASILGR